MLFGAKSATVVLAEYYAVHGDPMLRVLLDVDGSPPRRVEARLGPEQAYDNPGTGDRVAVTFVAGIVAELRPIAATELPP